jgi:hypothetical protein
MNNVCMRLIEKSPNFGNRGVSVKVFETSQTSSEYVLLSIQESLLSPRPQGSAGINVLCWGSNFYRRLPQFWDNRIHET